MFLKELLVGVGFFPELNFLVVVVELPGSLSLPDELLGLGLHPVQPPCHSLAGSDALGDLLDQLHPDNLLFLLRLEGEVFAGVCSLGQSHVDQ